MIDLCLTLAEGGLDTLQQKVNHYAGRVRYIEVRLDYLEEPGLPELPADGRTDFLATCRPGREGGLYQGEETERLRLLSAAAKSGFSWVDLEHDVEADLELPSSTRVVRSCHCFDDFPEDLDLLLGRLRQAGGDLFKMALTVNRTHELTQLLGWMESLPPSLRYVVLGMGDLGQPARFLGAFLGNSWTYVAAAEERKAAAGQFTVREAEGLYRLTAWKSQPEIYGVIGNPVAHSLSPWIHNRLFQEHGLDRIYLPLPVDDVGAWLAYAGESRLPFRGFSVTIPFKTQVLEFIQRKNSPVDSVNTLLREDSHWGGINTDYPGFLKALESRLSLQGRSALVLGNGGVAHTVVKALQDQGAEVTVVGRDAARLNRFSKLYGCPVALFSDLPIRADMCVNTTPVGQYPHVADSPLDDQQLDFELVYDLIYHPQQTRLLDRARGRGLQTVSGMEMFVEQAALQFEAWTGLSPDRDRMAETIRKALER